MFGCLENVGKCLMWSDIENLILKLTKSAVDLSSATENLLITKLSMQLKTLAYYCCYSILLMNASD